MLFFFGDNLINIPNGTRGMDVCFSFKTFMIFPSKVQGKEFSLHY